MGHDPTEIFFFFYGLGRSYILTPIPPEVEDRGSESQVVRRERRGTPTEVVRC